MTEPWLTGWKDISAYIGVCERTAMRYTDDYGMPVRRLPSGKVTMLRTEANQWRLKYNIKASKKINLS